MKYLYSTEEMQAGDTVLFIFSCSKPGAELDGEYTYDKGSLLIPCIVNTTDYIDEFGSHTIILRPYYKDNDKWKIFVMGKTKNGEYKDSIQFINSDAPSYRIIKYDWFTKSGAVITKEHFIPKEI